MATRAAVFPGTFDPVTHGHLDVIRRAQRLFDRLVVAVADPGNAGGKATSLSLDERVGLIRAETAGLSSVSVAPLRGLLVEFARSEKAVAIVRGVRSYADWEYELRMLEMNRHLAPELETVFLAPAAEHAFVSSTLVREVAALGGDLSGLVPPGVAAAVGRRLAPRAR